MFGFDMIRSSVSRYLNSTASTLQSIAHAIMPSYPTVYHTTIDVLEGYSRVFYPSNMIKLLRSHSAGGELIKNISANLFVYLGKVLVSEIGLKLLRSYLPLNNGINQFCETIVRFYLLRLFAETNINHTVDKISLATMMKNEAHIINNQFNYLPDNQAEIIKSNGLSLLYNISNFGMLSCIEKMVPGGQYIAQFVKPLAYGQLFLEYKMSGSLNTQHRYEVLTKNNAYVYGYGLSFQSINYFLNYIIKLFGFNNVFIENAIYNSLTSYFIAASYLMDDTPLAGKENGVDLFYLNRSIVDKIIDIAHEKIMPYGKKVAKQNIDFKKIITNVSQNEMIFILEYLLLGTTVRSIEDIKKLSAIHHCINVHEPEWKDSIVQVEKAKMLPYIDDVVDFYDYASFVPKPKAMTSAGSLLYVILNEKSDQFIHLLKMLLIQIRINNLTQQAGISYQEKENFCHQISQYVAKLCSYDPKQKDYILVKKIAALNDLQELIKLYYNNIDLKKVISVWSEYNKHIIATPRFIYSRLLDMFISGKTKTEAFLDCLFQGMNNQTSPTIVKEKDNKQNEILIVPNEAEDTNSDDVRSELLFLLTEKENQLAKEKDLEKAAAIQALSDRIVNLENKCCLNKIITDWKNTYNDAWQSTYGQSIAKFRHYAMVNHFFKAHTTTHSFIEMLLKKWGDNILTPLGESIFHKQIKKW